MGPIKPAQNIDRPGPTLRSDTRGRKRLLNGGSTSLSVKRQRYTYSPQDSVNVLPPEEKKTAERKIELTQPAKRPSLEQRLRDIPAGTPGNRQQAERELQKVQYNFEHKTELTSGKPQIMCYATYGSETEPKATICITFQERSWKINYAHRDKTVAFHMNDLIRQVYIKAAEKSLCDIDAPDYIATASIEDEATIKQLTLNSKAEKKSWYEIEKLYPTPWGTLLKKILSDFNFRAEYYAEFEGNDRLTSAFQLITPGGVNVRTLKDYICTRDQAPRISVLLIKTNE